MAWTFVPLYMKRNGSSVPIRLVIDTILIGWKRVDLVGNGREALLHLSS